MIEVLQSLDCGSIGTQEVICRYGGDGLIFHIHFSWDTNRFNILNDLNDFDLLDLEEEAYSKNWLREREA